ncbi:MAG TPA: MCP four helix bundle domain-containing protein, partial [Rhodocyclaceae bacterium]|nr:MCP four helix bundle domain-containing protein [Rhodocyclaceae bacterium]
MNIRTRTLLSPLIAVAAMLVLGAVAFLGMRTIQSSLHQLASVNMRKLTQINAAHTDLLAANGDVFRLFTYMSSGIVEDKVRQQAAVIDARIEGTAGTFRTMAETALSDEEKRSIESILEGVAKYRKSIRNAVDMGIDDVTVGAGMAGGAGKVFDGVAAEIGKLAELQKTGAAAAMASTQASLSRILTIAVIVIVLSLIVSLVVAWRVSLGITRPLNRAVSAANAIAGGNLSTRIEATSEDEIGQLMIAMATMQQALVGIVGDIKGIVSAANEGDFSVKINLGDKAGYTKELSELLNQLSGTVDGAINDIGSLAQSLEQGDLTRSITRDYQGAFDLLKQSLNN